MIEVFYSTKMVIILQYINISNQHIVYVNYISIKNNKMYVISPYQM